MVSYEYQLDNPISLLRHTAYMEMEMESKDIRKLGVVGILKEAVRLLRQKPMLFLQLTVCFLCSLDAIVQFLNYGLSLWGKSPGIIARWDLFQSKFFSDQIIALENSDNHSIFLDTARVLGEELPFFVVSSSFELVIAVVILYAAAATLKGQTVTLSSLLAFLPGGIKRMFLTHAVSLLFVLGITAGYALVAGLSVIFIYSIVAHHIVMLLLIIVACIIFVIGLVYLHVVWLLWAAIAVLEENWGADCLHKSVSLSKGKGLTSLLLVGILSSIEGCIDHLRVMLMRGAYASIITGGLMQLATSTVFNLLKYLTTTVLYFVCISYHEQSTSFGSQVDGDFSGHTRPQNSLRKRTKPSSYTEIHEIRNK